MALQSQEEKDLAKAIALSLKEAKTKPNTQVVSNLYPSAVTESKENIDIINKFPNSSLFREPRKVKALYDFEAAEDNEITFKAGETISVLDDSDDNWWRGSTWRGEGLFPANFVTSDLNQKIEQDIVKSKKSVSFEEEVQVLETPTEEVQLDETKIEKTLEMIQNVDPSEDDDSPQLLHSEEHCRRMGPLIDQELEHIDKKHIELSQLNWKLVEALRLYSSLLETPKPPNPHIFPLQSDSDPIKFSHSSPGHQGGLPQNHSMSSFPNPHPQANPPFNQFVEEGPSKIFSNLSIENSRLSNTPSTHSSLVNNNVNYNFNNNNSTGQFLPYNDHSSSSNHPVATSNLL